MTLGDLCRARLAARATAQADATRAAASAQAAADLDAQFLGILRDKGMPYVDVPGTGSPVVYTATGAGVTAFDSIPWDTVILDPAPPASAPGSTA